MVGLQWWAPHVWRSLGLAEQGEAVPAILPLPAALTQDHPPPHGWVSAFMRKRVVKLDFQFSCQGTWVLAQSVAVDAEGASGAWVGPRLSLVPAHPLGQCICWLGLWASSCLWGCALCDACPVHAEGVRVFLQPGWLVGKVSVLM